MTFMNDIFRSIALIIWFSGLFVTAPLMSRSVFIGIEQIGAKRKVYFN